MSNNPTYIHGDSETVITAQITCIDRNVGVSYGFLERNREIITRRVREMFEEFAENEWLGEVNDDAIKVQFFIHEKENQK